MSRRRGGGRGGGMEEHHVDERWMASYMDMVTVLMCLFIVLFAMSTVDSGKYEQLKNSLSTGFGVEDQGKIDNAIGVPSPDEQPGETVVGMTDLHAAEVEVDKLAALRDQMNANLAAQGLTGTVTFVIDQRGLTAKLVGSQSYFLPDSPVLQAQTLRILGAIAPVLKPIPEEIHVEGHAANGVTAYPSVWELSGARATAVLRTLVESGGVAGNRIGAVGFGSARQVNNDSNEVEHMENRRVDVVVISDQPERIRALIPEVLQARVK